MIDVPQPPGGLCSPSDKTRLGILSATLLCDASQRETSACSPCLSAKERLQLFTSRNLAATAAAIPPSSPQSAAELVITDTVQQQRPVYMPYDLAPLVNPSSPYTLVNRGESNSPWTQPPVQERNEVQVAESAQHQQQQQKKQKHTAGLQKQHKQHSGDVPEHRLHSQSQKEEKRPQTRINYCFDNYPADALTWKGRAGIRSGLTPSRKGSRRQLKTPPSVPTIGQKDVGTSDCNDRDPSLGNRREDISCSNIREEQQQQQSRPPVPPQPGEQQVGGGRSCLLPFNEQPYVKASPRLDKKHQPKTQRQQEQQEQHHSDTRLPVEQPGYSKSNSRSSIEVGKTRRQQNKEEESNRNKHMFVKAEPGSAAGIIMSHYSEDGYVRRNFARAAVAPIVSPASASVHRAVDSTHKLRGEAACAGVPSVQPPRLWVSTAQETQNSAAAAVAAVNTAGGGPRLPPISPLAWPGVEVSDGPVLGLNEDVYKDQWERQPQQETKEPQQKQQHMVLPEQYDQEYVQQLQRAWGVKPKPYGRSKRPIPGKELISDVKNTRAFQRLLRSSSPCSQSSHPPSAVRGVERQHRSCLRQSPRPLQGAAGTGACSCSVRVDAEFHRRSPPVRRYLLHDKKVLEQLGLPVSKADLFRYARELEKMCAPECACLRQRRSAAAAAGGGGSTAHSPSPDVLFLRRENAATDRLDAVAVPRWMLDYGVRDPTLSEARGGRRTSAGRSSNKVSAAAAKQKAPARASTATARNRIEEISAQQRAAVADEGVKHRGGSPTQYGSNIGGYFYLYPTAGKLTEDDDSATYSLAVASSDPGNRREERSDSNVCKSPLSSGNSPGPYASHVPRNRKGSPPSYASPHGGAAKSRSTSGSPDSSQAGRRYRLRDSRSLNYSGRSAATSSHTAAANAAPPFFSSPYHPSLYHSHSSSRPLPFYNSQGLDTSALEPIPFQRYTSSCYTAAPGPPYLTYNLNTHGGSATGMGVAAPSPSGVRGGISPGLHLKPCLQNYPERSYLQPHSRNATQTSSSAPAQTSKFTQKSPSSYQLCGNVAYEWTSPLVAPSSSSCYHPSRRRDSTYSSSFPLSPRDALVSNASHGTTRKISQPERQLQQLSEQVWACPRIVALLCSYLPLPQLLQVRRCSKHFLVAAQYEMRYILYATLQQLLIQEAQKKDRKGQQLSSPGSRRRSSISSSYYIPHPQRPRSPRVGPETPAFPDGATKTPSSVSSEREWKRPERLLREKTSSSKKRGQSLPACPFSADALIRLLHVKTDVIEQLKKGYLPPRRAIDAASPREKEIKAAAEEFRRYIAEHQGSIKKPEEQQQKRGRQRRGGQLSPLGKRYSIDAENADLGASEVRALEEEVLFRRAMQFQWQQELLHREQRLQQQEHNLFLKEELLRLQQREQHRQLQRYRANARIREGAEAAAAAALPVATTPQRSSWTPLNARPGAPQLSRRNGRPDIAAFDDEPPVFRRLRYAFLKLWNYNEDIFKYSYVWQRMAQMSGYWLCPAPGSPGPGREIVAGGWEGDGAGHARSPYALSQAPPQRLQPVSLQQLLTVSSSGHGNAPHPRGRSTGLGGFADITQQRSNRNDVTRMMAATAHAAPTTRSSAALRSERDSYGLQKGGGRWRGRENSPKNAIQNTTRGQESEGKKTNFSAGKSFGVRPSVRSSIEMRLAKLPDEFIDAFVLYGQQQARAHQDACWATGRPDISLSDRKAARRGYVYNASLHVLFDLYEWLAAALTFLVYWESCVPCSGVAGANLSAAPPTATRSRDARYLQAENKTTGTAARSDAPQASRTTYYGSSGKTPAGTKHPYHLNDKERSSAAMMPCLRGRSRDPRALTSSAPLQQHRPASQKSAYSLGDATALCRLLQNQALILEDVKLILKHLSKQV